MALFDNGDTVGTTTTMVPTPAHHTLLYSLALEAGSSWPWTESTRSYPAFERSFYEHYVMCAKEDRRLNGYIAPADYHSIHAFAGIRVYLTKSSRQTLLAEDLGCDSAAICELVVRTEDIAGVGLPRAFVDPPERFETVGDLWMYLQRLRGVT